MTIADFLSLFSLVPSFSGVQTVLNNGSFRMKDQGLRSDFISLDPVYLKPCRLWRLGRP